MVKNHLHTKIWRCVGSSHLTPHPSFSPSFLGLSPNRSGIKSKQHGGDLIWKELNKNQELVKNFPSHTGPSHVDPCTEVRAVVPSSIQFCSGIPEENKALLQDFFLFSKDQSSAADAAPPHTPRSVSQEGSWSSRSVGITQFSCCTPFLITMQTLSALVAC